jgi:hypothetical protein
MFLLFLLISGCASDKKIPPPPQGSILDFTQAADSAQLTRPRQLLEGITGKAGEARKVDAYRTSEDCSKVADFYNQFMAGAHWSALPVELMQSDDAALKAATGSREFANGWKYMSRTSYIAGAPEPMGCVVITAIFDHGRRNRYQAK